MTSALQGAFRHARVGVQVFDSVWFDSAPKKETENGRGGRGDLFFGAGEQSMDSFSVDVLKDGELQRTDVTDVTLPDVGYGNRHFVRNQRHLGVGTRILDDRRGTFWIARPSVSARSGRGIDAVEIGIYDGR
ncbi:MAG: hypothetical protein OXN18_09715 [Gemmatimonadota bacterium]|nr:hypothetical protein [Gemmatimonadota bacterium]